MTLHTDPVAVRFEKFLAVEGAEIIQEYLALVLSGRSNVDLIWPGVSAASLESVQRTSTRLMGIIESLCRGQEMFDLLLLFRRLPISLFVALLDKALAKRKSAQMTIDAVMAECILFGSNCILNYCDNTRPAVTADYRYTRDLTTADFKRAIGLGVVSVFHRFNVFSENAIARRDLINPVSYLPLLEIFNQRQERRQEPLQYKSGSDYIVGIAMIMRRPAKENLFSFLDSQGRNHEIVVRNYAPVKMDANSAIAKYRFLDTDDFARMNGISFRKWCAIWLSINRLLAMELILLWPPNATKRIATDWLQGAIDKTDDFVETGLGSAQPKQLAAACREEMSRSKSLDDLPTLEEVLSAIDSLTLDKTHFDVRFTEQPVLFYEVGRDRVAWDYLRHGGLIRALARRLITTYGANETREKKGKHFEVKVQASLRKIAGRQEHVKNIQVSSGGQGKWDIDVCAIFRGRLLAVEVKNRFKPVRHYFDMDVDVAGRVEKFDSWLAKGDKKLSLYKEEVQAKWPGVDLVGGIFVICSEETELVTSFDRRLWLDVGRIPRICLLDELTEFLSGDAFGQLDEHPHFVPFS